MAFEFSSIKDPVPGSRPRGGRYSEFYLMVQSIPIGKAIIVSGMPRNNVSSRVNQYKLRNPGTDFSVSAVGDGSFQITRKA